MACQLRVRVGFHEQTLRVSGLWLKPFRYVLPVFAVNCSSTRRMCGRCAVVIVFGVLLVMISNSFADWKHSSGINSITWLKQFVRFKIAPQLTPTQPSDTSPVRALMAFHVFVSAINGGTHSSKWLRRFGEVISDSCESTSPSADAPSQVLLSKAQHWDCTLWTPILKVFFTGGWTDTPPGVTVVAR